MTGEPQGLDNLSALAYMYYKLRKGKKTLGPPRVLLGQSPLTPKGSVALNNLLHIRLQQWGRKHQNVLSPLRLIF